MKQVKIKETVFERIIVYMKTETKGTLKVCWQCGVQSMTGRYEKTRVNLLTTIMTD